jgi:signal transduction histidine kinase
MENAWLYEKAQRSLDRIRALHAIDKAIASSLDLDTVLRVLLEKVEVFLLQGGTCVVHLFDPASGTLDRVACHDPQQRYSTPVHERGYDNIPRLVANDRVSVTVLDLETDSRTQDFSPFGPDAFTSYLGVPLMVRDEVLGVLSYFTPLEHSFTDQEIEFLATLGGQGAIAIHNARLYEEIKKQAIDLENSNKIKDDFLCVVSHELKTPLLAISGYTALLKDSVLGSLTEEQQRATDVIERNGHDLMHMVHSILEATKLQNRTVTILRENISIPDLLGELAQTYNVPRDKPVEIHWNYEKRLPPLLSDRDKLKHVLQNLIYNAVKFTEAGRITISATHFPDQDKIQFEVRDTGIGISPEQLPLIYEKFRQVDGSANRGYEGAGLGLYIVKEFTHLLGGDVRVESQLGKGSIFTVTLPCVYWQSAIDNGNKAIANAEHPQPLLT